MVRFSFEGNNGENNDEDVCDSLSLTIKMSYGCDKQRHPRFMWETTPRDGSNTNKSDDDEFDGSGVSMDDDIDDKTTTADLEFVKNFTRPNFPMKEFYTLKTRKSRLFSPTINSKNTSLSVIWPSFG